MGENKKKEIDLNFASKVIEEPSTSLGHFQLCFITNIDIFHCVISVPRDAQVCGVWLTSGGHSLTCNSSHLGRCVKLRYNMVALLPGAEFFRCERHNNTLLVALK